VLPPDAPPSGERAWPHERPRRARSSGERELERLDWDARAGVHDKKLDSVWGVMTRIMPRTGVHMPATSYTLWLEYHAIGTDMHTLAGILEALTTCAPGGYEYHTLVKFYSGKRGMGRRPRRQAIGYKALSIKGPTETR